MSWCAWVKISAAAAAIAVAYAVLRCRRSAARHGPDIQPGTWIREGDRTGTGSRSTECG
jgi:hypothetical protein